MNVAPKEQPPRKLSGKRTVHINSGKRIILAEGANLSGTKDRGGNERVNMEVKKTSLFNLHQKNGAKFVEFAGYQMPIQYKEGIIEEHKYTRTHSGIFDVSHMGQLFITGGDDLTKELEKIFPTDLMNLPINKSKYSFLMNDNAGIHDDLIITKVDNGFMIILNAACKENDFKIITTKFIYRTNFTIRLLRLTNIPTM